MVINVFILIGLLVSALARLIVPGQQPIRMLMTSATGILGAMIGGSIGSTIWPIPEPEPPPPAEPLQCVVIPGIWELISTAILPGSDGVPAASQLSPALLSAITSAALALRAYFGLSGRQTSPLDRG